MAIEILDALRAVRLQPQSIANVAGLAAIQKFISPTGEPIKSFMWEVAIRSTPAAAQQLPTLAYYAKTITIPASEMDTIQVNYLGHKFNYLGKDSSSHTIQMSFWDDQNFPVYDYFQSWYNSTHTPIYGQQVSKSNYNRTVTIQLRDTTDLFVVASITLYGVILTSVGEISLDYENSGVFTIPVTMMFDRKVIGALQPETEP